jgi:CBS domain-containing protein
MGQIVRNLMTKTPTMLPASASVMEAAMKMKEGDIGDILVMKDKSLCGIITDRDIVVRTIADGRDPARVTLDEVCSHELTTLSPDDDIGKAVQLMRDKGIRRLPVTEKGQAVGILSLGDLAQTLDSKSVLGAISAKPPTQ